MEHIPLPPTTPRKVSVRSIEGNPPNAKKPQTVTDGGLCETMALEFEVSDVVTRFPLAVGHITGFEAPGCDILSFESQEGLAAFLDPASRNLATVVRFIQVKGRGSATARIDLKGNELIAARRYADRYDLYRFYKDGDEGYNVTILKDPLQQEDAISTAIYVDLDRAQTSKRYHLTPCEPRGVGGAETVDVGVSAIPKPFGLTP